MHGKLMLWRNLLLQPQGPAKIHSKQTYARPPTAPPYLNRISHKGPSHLSENINTPREAVRVRREPALSLIPGDGGRSVYQTACVQACVQAGMPYYSGSTLLCTCERACHEMRVGNMDVNEHSHTPTLTGGCGKEVVPELGSACLWLREREE